MKTLRANGKEFDINSKAAKWFKEYAEEVAGKELSWEAVQWFADLQSER